MGHAALRQCGPAGLGCNILHMRGAHDALVIYGDIHKELIQRDILLGGGSNQIMKLKAVMARTGCPSSFASYSPFRR